MDFGVRFHPTAIFDNDAVGFNLKLEKEKIIAIFFHFLKSE